MQAIGGVDHLTYVAGALYYNEHTEEYAQGFNVLQCNAASTGYTLLPIDYRSQRIDRAARAHTEIIGMFGQATYTPPLLGGAIHLTGGARWTRDRKTGVLYLVNSATPSVNGVPGPQILEISHSRINSLVTLLADLSGNVHAYVKWSSGYKSGGANARSLSLAPFGPESVLIFEGGFKIEFLHRHARFNLAT